jgi:hypothetical protein
MTAASADGAYLWAGGLVDSNYIYGYEVATESWQGVQPSVFSVPWSAIDVSADGSDIIVAGIYNDPFNSPKNLFISDDYGANWTFQAPGEDDSQYWRAVAVNASGTNFMAASQPGSFYVYSSGSGGGWAEGLADGFCIDNAGCRVDYTVTNTEQISPYTDNDYLGLNADGFYSYDAGSFSTLFRRRIIIEPVEGTTDVIKVTVTVTWTYNGQELSYTTSQYLYNWH